MSLVVAFIQPFIVLVVLAGWKLARLCFAQSKVTPFSSAVKDQKKNRERDEAENHSAEIREPKTDDMRWLKGGDEISQF